MIRVLLHVLVPVLAACAMNVLIFSLGWNMRTGPVNPWIPPGAVVGAIWIVLLGLLGYVHYLCHDHWSRFLVIGTVVFCVMYPVFTAGLKQTRVARLLNLLTLLIAFVAAWGVHESGSRVATWCMLPLVLWASYVNFADAIVC